MTKADINTIVEMRQQGYTLQQIGDRFGATRERIRQQLVEYERKNPPINRPLTRNQLEKLLGISEGTLNRLGKKGLLRPLRMGNSFHLYYVEELEAIRAIIAKHCLGCGKIIPRAYDWCSPCLLEHRKEYNRLYQRHRQITIVENEIARLKKRLRKLLAEGKCN